MIDINTVFMWLVRGFDGVINSVNKMLDEGQIAGEGPLQHCEQMRDNLNRLIERMERLQGKK